MKRFHNLSTRYLGKILYTSAAVTCPGDSDVPHSKVLLDSQPVGSEIEVQCEEGYQSEGSMVAYCQEDQTWTTPEGQCQSKNYCKLSSVKHSHCSFDFKFTLPFV